jgi:hypothetical protein
VNVIRTLLVFARRRRWLVIGLTAAFSAMAAVVCGRISFETDVLNLLPRDTAALSGFRRYVNEFGELNHLYIVFTAPEGQRIEDDGLPAADADWSYLQDRVFLLLGPEAAKRALERFEPEPMRDALRQSRDLLTAPSSAVKNLVQADPLGFLTLLRERFAADRALAELTDGDRGYVSEDGRSRLIIATPAAPPFDGAFCRRLFDRLASVERETKDGLNVPDAGGVVIAYAGGHRIALETESIIRKEAIVNSVTSVAAILLLLLIVFRSAWLFVAGAIPMAVATLGSIAINGLIHDRLSAAATGTSALLFGLGIDGLVLMYVVRSFRRGARVRQQYRCGDRTPDRRRHEHAPRVLHHRGDLLRADLDRLARSAGTRPPRRGRDASGRPPDVDARSGPASVARAKARPSVGRCAGAGASSMETADSRRRCSADSGSPAAGARFESRSSTAEAAAGYSIRPFAQGAADTIRDRSRCRDGRRAGDRPGATAPPRWRTQCPSARQLSNAGVCRSECPPASSSRTGGGQ